MFMCVMKGDETRHETPTRVKKVYFLCKFHPAHNLVLQIAPSPVYSSQEEFFALSWQNLMKRRTLISFNMRQSCNLCWCCKKVTLAKNRSNGASFPSLFFSFSNIYARCGKSMSDNPRFHNFFTASCARSSIRPSTSCVAINVNFPPEMSICSSQVIDIVGNLGPPTLPSLLLMIFMRPFFSFKFCVCFRFCCFFIYKYVIRKEPSFSWSYFSSILICNC